MEIGAEWHYKNRDTHHFDSPALPWHASLAMSPLTPTSRHLSSPFLRYLLSSLLPTTLSFTPPTRTQIWLLPNLAAELSSKSILYILTQGAQLNKGAFHLQESDCGFQ